MNIRSRIIGGMVGLILAVLAMSTYYLLNLWMIAAVLLTVLGTFIIVGTSVIDVDEASKSFFTDHTYKEVQGFLVISTIVCVAGGIVSAFPFFAMIPSLLGEQTYEGGIFVSLISLSLMLLLFMSAYTNYTYYDGGFEKKKKEISQVALENEMYSHIVQNTLLEKNRNFKEKHAALLAKYGKPSKEICLSVYDIKKNILVFESSKIAWLCGKAIPMKDILGCTILDHFSIIKGDTTSFSETNRPVRDINGKATSPEKSHLLASQDEDAYLHDYTLIVTINNLSEPKVRIHVGNDEKKTYEIASLIDVIVRDNS